MKIEHPHTPIEPNARVASGGRKSPAKAANTQGADAVRLSSDLQLADRAVRAVAADEVRPDAVTRGRALLERGGSGIDVERLADRIIDALLHSDDTSS